MLPTSWYGNWKGLSAAVFGLGKSGFSVADTLIELGVTVTVYAKSSEPQLTELVGLIGASFVPSDQPSLVDWEVDFVVASPGFAPDHPLIKEALARGLTVTTDIELAYLLGDKVKRPDWIVITGTNGKTTTTELTCQMLVSGGFRAVPCGNIGNPILDAVRDPEGFDFLVVELSSFQLHYLGVIAPKASAFLNLAEDHYDWHGSPQAYFAAKAKIFENTELAIVYNAQDQQTLLAAEQAEVQEGCRAIGFSVGVPGRSMVGFVEEFLVDRAFIENRADAAQELASIEDIEQLGIISRHLLANVAASAALARSVGVEPAAIRNAIREFKLAPHRIQLIGSVDQVQFVDDSKATNAHAADASLSSFDSVVWIVGGLLKGVDPAPLIKKHAARLKAAVVIGRDTSELESLFAELCPHLKVSVISGGDIMSQAVFRAKSLASEGDTVLLAPAAASMDQFLDYADRGQQFQLAVRGLMA